MRPQGGLGLVAALLIGAAAQAQAPAANYDEAKAGTFTLPDPLVFRDGKPVRTAKDWTRRRRPELMELFAENIYGRSPEPPKSINYKVFEEDKQALGGKAVRRQVTIYFSPKREDGPKEDILIYLPADATKPVPVIFSTNFFGNHTVTTDPAVKRATVWSGKTHERMQAPEESRGRDKGFDVEKVLARGYGFATVCYQDIEPDFKGAVVHGIRPLFYKPGQTELAPDDWGAIGAWSYGLSRALDYLQTDKAVDARRVAVLGFSRLGKAVLWAGAQDTRFAMVLSVLSGEGGASLYRRDYGERVRNLAGSFPYWFAGNFRQYVDQEEKLPVDAHELIALIAPRPVYITGAEDDKWGDPRGEFLACVAAGPVYRLLGAQDLGTDRMPPLNQPIRKTIGYHYRTGKHEVTAFDWDQFLNFADLHLKK